MKRKTIMISTALLCLCLSGCGKEPENVQGSQESHGEAAGTEKHEEAAGTESHEQVNVELIGPWHLDAEKNDLAAFSGSLDLFPGYGEWGASMEIRSNGQMSWYIGAEGWNGTYTVEDGVIRAELTSNLDQSTQLWDFRIILENETVELEMDDKDMTIYWVYGDREDL